MKKVIFYVFLFLSLYFFITSLGWIFVEPVLSRLGSKEYHSVITWDSGGADLELDLDRDGKTDLITYAGCIYLSSFNNLHLSEECWLQQVNTLPGQAFLQPVVTNHVPFKSPNPEYPAAYAYLLIDHDNHWKVVVMEKTGRLYQVEQGDNQLLFTENVPWDVRVDAWLYRVSYPLFVLNLPLFMVLSVPVALVFQALWTESDVSLVLPFVVPEFLLILLTVFFFKRWRRSAK